MRISCYKWLLAIFCFLPFLSQGQETNLVDPSFQRNLKTMGQLFVAEEQIAPFSIKDSTFSKLEDDRTFFYLDFDVAQAYIQFDLDNPSNSPQNIDLRFSYPFLEDVQLLKLKGQNLEPVGRIGLASGIKPAERTWNIAFLLQPESTSSYILLFNKSQGKPLATDIVLYGSEASSQITGFQDTFVGVYFGVTALSIFFALFIFGLTRYSVFLLYGIYLVALSVYLGAFLGYTNLFLPLEKIDSGRTIYGLSIDISTITFTMFAQKLLRAKKYVPKLKVIVESVIIVLILLRLIWHLKFDFWTPSQIAFFMKSWYGIICFLVCVIVVQIFVYIRYNRKVGAYFALSYLFMTIGSVLMILHHSFGLLKISFYGLSHLLFASMIEIVFLSITIAMLMGQIYQDRNALANRLVVQQQKFLNAFIQGQEEERKRLGTELHDNIGSRLAHLKRVFASSYSDANIQKEFDHVSEEIRNMAHSITPAEIALVGLSEAVDELLEEVGQSSGLQVNFNTFQFPENLDESVATHLFRIVQELVQNVIKHANASLVNVQLFGHENSVTLSFEDNGRGMDQKLKPKGLGLRSIKSRVAQMNGQFLLDTSEGKGTSVLVIIPTKYT